jgi:protein tyrosine/serine phosphatase
MVNGHLQQRLKLTSRIGLTALVILLIGSGAWLWESRIKHHASLKYFGAVQEGQLYRSGLLPAALVKNVLTKYKIKVIIDLSANSPINSDRKAEEQAAAKLGIERLKFQMHGDGTGNINDYAQAVAAIARAEQQHKPVLVHCNVGLQRTGGVIAAYELLVEQMSPSSVYNEFTSYDTDPWNDTELFDFLNSHMEELAVLLKKMGVISDIPNPLPVFGASSVVPIGAAAENNLPRT